MPIPHFVALRRLFDKKEQSVGCYLFTMNMTSLCNSLDTAASVGSEIDDFEKKELAEIMEKVGTAINCGLERSYSSP